MARVTLLFSSLFLVELTFAGEVTLLSYLGSSERIGSGASVDLGLTGLGEIPS